MRIEPIHVKPHPSLLEQTNPLLASVFTYRNFSLSDMKQWLASPQLQDPRSIDCVVACEKILLDVLAKKEKILICGDYDADGICATAILMKAFQTAGFDAGFYIPDRLKEGYGLNVHTVEMAYEKGYRTFITVDNGVKSFEAMQKIKALNCRCILTDHHTYENDEIQADCFVHPFIMDDALKNLSGAGVALQIARLFIPENKDIVALAAVATIADCMNLIGENHNIVSLGLRYLNEGVMPSLQLLKNKPEARFDETMIAFQIAPKLNGTGRMADLAKANNTVRYLLLNDINAIMDGARQINQVNEARKNKTSEMEKTARQLLQEGKFQVIASESFHEGIVGLVASRIANDTGMPCAVLSYREGRYKGSIRSIEGLNLMEFFSDFKHFEAFGGHAMAAGITIKDEYYHDFVDYIRKNEATITESEKIQEVLVLDEKICTLENVKSYQCCAPFGNGFEPVVFAFENMKIRQTQIMQDKHCKLISESGIEILFFNARPSLNYLVNLKQINVYGTLSVSVFKGVETISLIAKGYYER